MSRQDIYLIKFGFGSRTRGHFALYAPDGEMPGTGTLINVIGTPLQGFFLEILPSHNLEKTDQRYSSAHLGTTTNLNAMQRLASTIQPPRGGQNVLEPVDGVRNRRCQEWTMDYVQLLVQQGLLSTQAIELVQANRDPPTHGVGLRPVNGQQSETVP